MKQEITSDTQSIRGLTFFLVLALACSGLAGQNNLIRNHSFENRGFGVPGRFPDNPAQLEKCARWQNIGLTTSDWFRNNSPAHQHGAAGCEKGNQYWDNNAEIPSDDLDHYAGSHRWENVDGEGLQQKLPHKLRNRTYILRFDYFMPCDTNPYRFDVYFGTNKNSKDYHVKFDTLDRQLAGQWNTYEVTFSVSPSDANQYDWFIWLFDGNFDSGNPLNSDGSYLFVDNFILEEHPLNCDACDVDGLISWNQRSPRPYMTPNNDGIFDQWCTTNINNVSWYELWVIARWGPVFYETGAESNGYENLSVCWDGRDGNGQLLPHDTYQIVLILGNCGSQISRHYGVAITHDLQYDAFSVDPSYVPPLFGLEPSPTHYRDLHLYGGPYYGTHDWYACDSIIIANDGAPRVPYFWAASSSNLGFHFGLGFDTQSATDFRIDLGADVDIVPEPVQCCPQLRMADPDLLSAEVDSIGEVSALEGRIDDEEERLLEEIYVQNESKEFTVNVYPNPVADVLNIDFYLPSRDFFKATLINTSGIPISEVLNLAELEMGAYSYSVSVKAIPDGMYFLKLTRRDGLVTVKVVLQR